MKKKYTRRDWLHTAAAYAIPVLAGEVVHANNRPVFSSSKLKISLNAYSFNAPLVSGAMSVPDLLAFCAKNELDGLDLTAYYLQGYPVVPPDEYLYEIKRLAFRLGIDITGTGVRNDFANPDPEMRAKDVELVKNWVVAASKIGAPVIRIFSGHHKHEGYSREKVLTWMVKDIKECVAFGKRHGVVVAVQNHHDFLLNADQTIELIEAVDSPWFGLILDIGSFRGGDPYEEIARCIPYAVNWQIKELVYRNGAEEKVDLKKLFPLIKASSYRGYLPVETLGPGDPLVKVPVFLDEVRKVLADA